MSERSVSDLIFRDVDAEPPMRRSAEEREATLREELDKLRPAETGPRVVPASRTSAKRPR